MMKVSFVNLCSSIPDINYYLKPFNKLEKEMKKLKSISMERIILKRKNPLFKLNYKVKLFINNNNSINKIKTFRNEKQKSLEYLNNISKSYIEKRNKKNEKTNLNQKIKQMNKTTNFKHFKIFEIKKNPFKIINLKAQHLIKMTRQPFLYENLDKTQFSSIRKNHQEHNPISNILIKKAIDKKVQKPILSFLD